MDLRNVNFFQNNKWSANSFDKNIVNSGDSQREAVKVLPFTPEIFKTGQDKLN
jgi:hypothetical protein